MGQLRSIETRMMEAQQRWGVVLKRKTNTEAAGPCPFCGLADEDGFLVFCDGGYWCRQCDAKGWINENDPNAEPPTKEQREEWRIRRLEQKQRELEQRLRYLEEMHHCEDHLAYHNNLTPTAREYWWREGIYDDAIERYLLGYCTQCPTYSQSASYTIPVFDRQHQLVNIRHRLVSPNGGKYRPHRAGLGNHLYNSALLNERRERILVVEGEKKSIVVTEAGFPAVGICGKRAFKSEWLRWFDTAREVVIALDPDARDSAWRLGEIFAKHGHRARVACMPAKPDDMIVKHGASSTNIEGFLRVARPVRVRVN